MTQPTSPSRVQYRNRVAAVAHRFTRGRIFKNQKREGLTKAEIKAEIRREWEGAFEEMCCSHGIPLKKDCPKCDEDFQLELDRECEMMESLYMGHDPVDPDSFEEDPS